MNKKIRLGFIGAGIFAEANLFPSLCLYVFDDVERVSICDLETHRAQRLAQKYGWQNIYRDYNEMLHKEALDAVIVCVGGKNAPTVTCDILKAKLPVFLEKPAGIRYSDTLKILEVSKTSQMIVQIDHQKRYGSPWMKAREIVQDTDEFGKIVQIESKQHGFEVFPTFYTCMLEWQSHNLDLVQSLCGEIVGVESRAKLLDERHGSFVAMLEFKSGALGTLAWGTYGGPGPFTERVEILSDKGKGIIVTNSRTLTVYNSVYGTIWEPDWNPISPNQSHIFNGYVPGLRAFFDCVLTGTQPVPSIEDESRTMYWLEILAKKAGIDIEWAPVSSAL